MQMLPATYFLIFSVRALDCMKPSCKKIAVIGSHIVALSNSWAGKPKSVPDPQGSGK